MKEGPESLMCNIPSATMQMLLNICVGRWPKTSIELRLAAN